MKVWWSWLMSLPTMQRHNGTVVSVSKTADQRVPGAWQGLALRAAMVGSAVLSGAVLGDTAIAADDVVFHYRALERRVAVADLVELVETGEPTRQLDYYLQRTNQSPAAMQTSLTRSVSLNVRMLDRGLNSLPGELVLDQLGRLFHTRSGQANRQALRAALVLSASDDGEVNALELMQNYPTPELHVNGDRLEEVYEQLVAFQALQERWGWILGQ